MEHGPYQVKAGWQESVGAPLQVYVEEVVEEGYKVKAECFWRGTHPIWMSAWHTILPGAGFCAQVAFPHGAGSTSACLPFQLHGSFHENGMCRCHDIYGTI